MYRQRLRFLRGGGARTSVRLEHDDFGLNQSKVIVIDSKGLGRDAGGKPVANFPHPALSPNQASSNSTTTFASRFMTALQPFSLFMIA
jgi:hypothetical protein